jgi:hypothetical protein
LVGPPEVGRERLLKAGVSVNPAKERMKAKRHGTKWAKIRFTTESTEDAEPTPPGPSRDSLNSVAEITG